MSIILNIDTSLETASVSIANDGIIVQTLINTVQKEHASFLHNAITKLLLESSIEISQVDAVAVTGGPGSYTGLRVGFASAKGLCYALNKPLITIGTLNAMAASAIDSTKDLANELTLFCPMIDARRMEVYTAVFDKNMVEILPATALILEEQSFEQILQKNHMIFFGSGTAKWNKIINSQNASFLIEPDIPAAFSRLSFEKFLTGNFTDLSYSEPLYVKEFFIQ